MLNKVLDTISKYKMLQPGERVCVALSGGADSVSLLLALKELKHDIFAVHVNHCLRGEESLRDEEFCRRLCDDTDITLFVERVNVAEYCQMNRLSTEEGARKLRYQAILKHCKGIKLATAHNLNDCFETTLFNLVRGCGVGGLKGIPPVRDNIIRPLIGITRSEIEEFLKDRDQGYVTDSTNLIDDCSRNILRLNVLPQLLRINPSLYKTYSKSLANFEEADNYLEAGAEQLFMENRCDKGLDLAFCRDDAVLGKAIGMLLGRNGIEPSFDRIAAVRELLHGGGRINISGGVYVKGEAGRITIEYAEDIKKDPLYIPHKLSGTVLYGERRVVFTEISQFDISDYNKSDLKYYIDTSKISGQTVLRSYKGSEGIRLPGRGFTSTVKKLLAVYPSDIRHEKLVIADDLGAVYVEGFGPDLRAACDTNTASAVRIEVI